MKKIPDNLKKDIDKLLQRPGKNTGKQIAIKIADNIDNLIDARDVDYLVKRVTIEAGRKIRRAKNMHSLVRYRDYENLEDLIDSLELNRDDRLLFVLQYYMDRARWSSCPEVFARLFLQANQWIYNLNPMDHDLVRRIEARVEVEYSRRLEKKKLPAYAAPLQDWPTEERLMDLIRDNNNLAPQVLEYDANITERMQKKAEVTRMLKTIPESYPDFFPVARTIHRKFYVHVGDTNSGKTYQAIEALKKAEGGIYLGPLRLLAYEKYRELNLADCPCNLITGEEARLVEGATFQSSTVELIDFNKYYPVAVIDEAQMIGDEERGGRWTAAILGVYSREVHVCLAPAARQLVIRLIKECGDEYEIINHTRNTPLIEDTNSFTFPEDVRPKDAIVLFSRASVHAAAAVLKNMGMRVSIIYGNLPYDVRQDQARQFSNGETDVVVCTDAIGMGINLPIKRVVFLELNKFDGKKKRLLMPSEVKQIAGRAGRFGIFDEGYYCTEDDGQETLHKLMHAYIPPIEEAYIQFPEPLLSVDLPLSALIERWVMLKKQEGYITALADRDVKLTRNLEAISEDKHLIYSFVTIPYDETSEDLYSIWYDAFIDYGAGQAIVQGDIDRQLMLKSGDRLEDLEMQSKICDLYYQLLNKTEGDKALIEYVLEKKLFISKEIMKRLENSEFQEKKCRMCGRRLGWNYPYRNCRSCREKTGGRRDFRYSGRRERRNS